MRLLRRITRMERIKMKNNITGIFAKKIEGNDAEFDIHGEIGWEVWFDRMKWLIESLADNIENVTFNIYSLGGDVWDGNAIVNLIGGMKQRTVANVQLAASMATAIALACDEVVMAKNGRWLVHNPWTFAIGDAASLETTAVDLRNFEKQFAEFYHSRCDGEKSLQDFVDLMNEERWMTADEAFEWGFVDAIEDVFNISAFASLNKMMAKAVKPMPADFLNQNEDKTMVKKTKKTPAVAGKNEETLAVAEVAEEVAEETPEIPEVPETPAEEPETPEVPEPPAEEIPETPEVPEDDGPTAAMKASIRSEVTLGFATEIQGYQNDIAERDTTIASLQSGIATVQAENSELSGKFDVLTARLKKFTKTGLTSDGEVTTWNEALADCGDDYVVARKKYGEIYTAFMEKAK